MHVHYAFHVDESALDATVERLRSFGYEPVEIDFDERDRAAYVDDPDGNVVEFWTWDVAGHLAE